jgi:hypothetical protein
MTMTNPRIVATAGTADRGDPERDERLRAEGRAQADNAISWHTTCVGCAGRLDSLIAERHEGADEAARLIVAELHRWGLRDEARLVEEYAAKGFQRAQEALDGRAGGVPG